MPKLFSKKTCILRDSVAYLLCQRQGAASEVFAMLESGSYSHGTLRQQDLLPAFLNVLALVDEQAATAIEADVPNAAFQNDEHPFWDFDDGHMVIEELIDALNEHVPEDSYFGAHPGDGSDFGVWEFYY
jgi:hypothetical protein